MALEIEAEVEEAFRLKKDPELKSLLEKASPDFPVPNPRSVIIGISDMRDANPPRIFVQYDVYSGEVFQGVFDQELILNSDRSIIAQVAYS